MGSSNLPPLTDSDLRVFVKSQFFVKPVPPPSSISLQGQTAIVTGSNSGLGLAAVGVLLEYHVSHIIMAVRTVEKGEKVAAPLRKAHPKAKIEVWQLDMLSYESVQAFAAKCSTLPRLDKVLLNAGSLMADFETNKSTGHESTIQVNYLSTALLAILLLPILKAKRVSDAPGRMTIVASGLALTSKFPNRDANPLLPSFDVPADWSAADAMERYSVSKTLVIMFLQRLAEIIDPSVVIVNTIEPGFIKGSGLQKNVPPLLRAITAVVKSLTGRTTQQGAWAHADALFVKGAESHGSLVMNWELYP